METGDREDQALEVAALLADPVRRALFEHVQRAPAAVSREEAAEAVGVSRKLAAFHLDKLVDAGLLVGRAAEGHRRVGRPPKLYAPSEVEVRLAIPPRSHDLLAELLVDAVTGLQPGEDGAAATQRTAAERGRRDGAAERERRRPGRLGVERTLGVVRPLLEDLGYRPEGPAGGPVRLRNCPFHPLADRSRALVCGLNRAYLAGLLEGLGAATVEAVLAPAPGRCCVELGPAAR